MGFFSFLTRLFILYVLFRFAFFVFMLVFGVLSKSVNKSESMQKGRKRDKAAPSGGMFSGKRIQDADFKEID